MLADTSIVVKWFHSQGESEAKEAAALLDAHRAGFLTILLLDLTIYELGNILLRRLLWTAEAAANQLQDLITICGLPLSLEWPARKRAAELSEFHGLSFYDAAFAGVAATLGIPLVSADRQLLQAGLAETATSLAARLLLSP